MIPVLFSVMLLASDAAAASPASAVPAAETATEQKAERQICKREPIASSQYRTKRVCLTSEQWKARARGDGVEDLGSVSTK